MQTLIAAIFVFGLLILAHELGHYYVARLTGIRVLELAVGFGPKLLSWTKNGIDYSLRAVPLGGFCRLMGENPEEAEDPDSFPKKPIPSRMAVLMAGSGMNLALAILVFFLIFFFIIGTPTDTAEVGYIVENSPAEETGLEVGDRIISIDNEPVQNFDDVVAVISVRPNEEFPITVERNGEEVSYSITAEEEPDGRGIIGIGRMLERYSFFSSVQHSFRQFGMILASFYYVLSGQAPLEVAGPVGIVHVIGEVAQTGFVNLLMLTALISINLGIINLLPIPALDGGRILFLIIEALRGRPIEPEKEGLIHFLGFALLITLILFITYQDVLRLFFTPN